ncbi:DUF1192 domain-containing protein [Microvirga sp. 2MCAF38]|uniref:DUF1192 domain-containing protein n=1 Tax=Microvirga sp. 2MCAF38 TaxID=3232989 RepID=UPI003F9ADA0F
MVFDPFADEPRQKKAGGFELGQDLSMLSLEELDERVAALEQEIRRLKDARSGKEKSRDAASAFFKLGST